MENSGLGSGPVLINGQTYNSLRGQQGVVFSTSNSTVAPQVNCMLSVQEMICQTTDGKQSAKLENCRIMGNDTNRQIYCLYPNVTSGNTNKGTNWLLWLLLLIVIVAIVWLVMRKHVDNGKDYKSIKNRLSASRRSPMRF